MRNLLLSVTAVCLLLSGCFFKSKKADNAAEQIPAAVQEQTAEQNTQTQQAVPQEEEEQAKPATLRQSVVDFFTPGTTQSKAKKAEKKALAAAAANEKKNQSAFDALDEQYQTAEQQEQTAEQNAQTAPAAEEKPAKPQYPEMLAQDDPEAVILKTEDGRLTSPFFMAKDATPEQIAALDKPVWFGETLKYNIGYSFIVAGVAELKTTRVVDNNGVLAYEMRADANSHSIIDSVFKVRDINASWMDVGLGKSLGYWQSVKEGKYARDEWVIFDYKNHIFNNHKQDKHGNIKTQKVAFEGDEVLDMLSSLYYVRTQDLPEKGEVYFDIVNRKEQYPLKVVVHGKKKVKVKAGTFNCILVEPKFSGEGIFISKGKSLKVWLTDDKYKMPVKMAVEVFIGSVTAELTEYTRTQK